MNNNELDKKANSSSPKEEAIIRDEYVMEDRVQVTIEQLTRPCDGYASSTADFVACVRGWIG